MPAAIQIIRTQDFLETSPEGEYDLAKSKQLLADLADVNKKEIPNNILIDIRRAQWSLSVFEVYDLANYLVEKFFRVAIKIAVLALPGTSFKRAEFLELCSRNRGIVIDTFTNFENAVHWFFSADPVTPQSLEN